MDFLIESFKHWPTIGAFAPCSSAVAEKMTRPVDFSRARVLVEFGGGTGAITKTILARMRPDAELVSFELLPAFVSALKRIPDSRLTVVHDSAANLGAYLAAREIEKADAIISTLPVGTMNKALRARIFEEVKGALGTGGRYVQIQYSLLSWKEIKRNFPETSLDFTPRNFPPAFFYICER
ncbi:phospholipid methyltransferase [Candidatus Kaiserbacteria bacterium]|nr:phospholipid methyltransferase [Candidatus Kaiserbacteria bacterium]